MTTVAVRDGIIACDSCVSGSFPNATIKIKRGPDFLIGFAGDWVAGEYLVECYINDDKPIRHDDDDVDILIARESGIYFLDALFREAKICEKYYAIGSGSQAAMVAMNMGATAVEAVREAIKVDLYSGGRVRSLSLA